MNSKFLSFLIITLFILTGCLLVDVATDVGDLYLKSQAEKEKPVEPEPVEPDPIPEPEPVEPEEPGPVVFHDNEHHWGWDNERVGTRMIRCPGKPQFKKCTLNGVDLQCGKEDHGRAMCWNMGYKKAGTIRCEEQDGTIKHFKADRAHIYYGDCK
ncbi:MAG: hypothetical protein PVG39_00765 [Desulfobacteraceae bacterium]|jgi:hypothetical protein